MMRDVNGLFKVSSDSIPLVDVDLCTVPEIVDNLSFEVDVNKVFKQRGLK